MLLRPGYDSQQFAIHAPLTRYIKCLGRYQSWLFNYLIFSGKCIFTINTTEAIDEVISNMLLLRRRYLCCHHYTTTTDSWNDNENRKVRCEMSVQWLCTKECIRIIMHHRYACRLWLLFLLLSMTTNNVDEGILFLHIVVLCKYCVSWSGSKIDNERLPCVTNVCDNAFISLKFYQS